MSDKITKLEMIHDEALKCELPLSVAKAISCFHNCVNHIDKDMANGYAETLKKFNVKEIVTIVSNRFILELSVNLILNALPEGEQREAFIKKAERAYTDFSENLIEKEKKGNA